MEVTEDTKYFKKTNAMMISMASVFSVVKIWLNNITLRMEQR